MKKKTRPYILHFVLLLILFAFLTPGCAATFRVSRLKAIEVEGKRLKADEIRVEEAAALLPVGERLTYNVSWLGIPVGQITSNIEGVQEVDGRRAYKIELVAKTNKFCSAIYPVNSKYISYMDVEDLVTLRHEVSRREGRFKKDAVTDFDQQNHRAHFKNLLDNSEKDFSIPQDAQDTLTAIYYFRTINVDVGANVNYDVVSSERHYSLFGSILRKQFIRLPELGTFESFLVVPYMKVDGARFKRASLSGYFSSDSSRIPLLGIIKGPLFSRLTLRLAKIEKVHRDEAKND